MLRHRLLTFLVFTCSFTSFAHAEFKVGVGKAIITPNPLLPISGGVGPGNPSSGKQGELYARAMVFQQGETKVAVVQLDLLGFPSVLCARVHKQVPRIPADNILIGSTHTHSAPDCYEYVSRTSLGEMTGEILIENALKLIADSSAAATSK